MAPAVREHPGAWPRPNRRWRKRQKWHGGFRTRREAETAKARLINDVHTGTYIEATKNTFAEWVESSWLPTMRSQVKASTWDSYMRTQTLSVRHTMAGRMSVRCEI